MQKITMLHELVSLVKVESSGQAKREGAFSIPGVLDNLGEVRHVSPSLEGKIKVGDKVYYGPKFDPIRMQGLDCLVMEFSNILAVLES